MFGNAVVRGLVVDGLLFALPASALEPGERVDNFRLLDDQGDSHELYYYFDASAVVIMVRTRKSPGGFKVATRRCLA